MKKICAKLVTLVLVLSMLLCACGEQTPPADTSGSASGDISQTESVPAETPDDVASIVPAEVTAAITYQPKSDVTNKKTVKIMPMGDSLTEGHFDPCAYRYALFEYLYLAGVDFEYVGPRTKYDNRLPETYGNHAGHGGITIEGMYKKLDEYLAPYDPDVILLNLGCNIQEKEGGKPAQTEQMKTLITKIFEMKPEVTIYLGDVPAGRWGENLPKNLPLNANLEAIVKEYQNAGKRIYYVPVNENALVPEDYTGEDGTHPLPSGNLKMAQVWYKYIVNDLLTMNDIGSTEQKPAIKEITGITLDQTEITVPKSQQKTLRATVAPADATISTVIWTSADESIATVDRNYGIVTAKGTGETTVYATTLQGRKVASCKVTVGKVEPLPRVNKLFTNGFVEAASYWSGCDYYANTKGITVEKAPAQFVSKRTFDIGNNYEISMLLCAPAGTIKDKGYTGLTVGELEMRLVSGATSIELWHKGAMVASVENFPSMPFKLELFTLSVNNGVVRIYRNNEVAVEANLEVAPHNDTITITNRDIARTVRYRDLTVSKIVTE